MSITSLSVVTRSRCTFGSLGPGTKLAEGQNAWPVLGRSDGMFPVCGTRAVCGSDCPLAVEPPGVASPRGQLRPDRQPGAAVKQGAGSRRSLVGKKRIHLFLPADPVPAV